jgi:hypothetical protein
VRVDGLAGGGVRRFPDPAAENSTVDFPLADFCRRRAMRAGESQNYVNGRHVLFLKNHQPFFIFFLH